MSVRQGNKIISGIAFTAGFVSAFAGSSAPSGWLVCDGSAVSRTDYADLFAAIGTTYGTGDGSTTFNLPDISDCFVQGGTPGTTHTAGLPNIKTDGTRSFIALQDYTPSGTDPFRRGTTELIGFGGSKYGANFDFDASRSSNIYGNSTTVQPKSVEMNWCIKY